MRPTRGNVALLGVVAIIFLMAPTAGDIGGCGKTATPLDEAQFAASRKAMDCKQCTKCNLGTQRCLAACDAGVPSDVSFPATCKPLLEDGLVCLRALNAASCDDYARYLSDTDPTIPTECQFCRVVPQPLVTTFADAGAAPSPDDGGSP